MLVSFDLYYISLQNSLLYYIELSQLNRSVNFIKISQQLQMLDTKDWTYLKHVL